MKDKQNYHKQLCGFHLYILHGTVCALPVDITLAFEHLVMVFKDSVIMPL